MMNWFNKLFASKTTKFYSGDNIGTVFTDMNKEDMVWTADSMAFGKEQRANVTLSEKNGDMKMRIAGCAR